MFWLLLVLRTAVALLAGIVVVALTWLVSQDLPLAVRLAAAAVTSLAVWVTGARADGEALRQEQQEQEEARAHAQEQ